MKLDTSPSLASRQGTSAPAFSSDTRTGVNEPAYASGDLEKNLYQYFNTAILKEVSKSHEPNAAELEEIARLPELKVLLLAVETLALDQGISAQEAAGKVFKVVQRLEATWTSYLVRKGFDSEK